MVYFTYAVSGFFKKGARNMIEKRRDNRGRLLHNGEVQLPDGRYRFKYTDAWGQVRAVYSLRLDHNDLAPQGKKRGLS